MKRTQILSLSLALALGLGTAALAAEDTATGDAAAGKALYTAKCASCHGADGTKSLMSKPVKGLNQADFSAMMLGYKAKTYGGTKKATMENVASKVSEADITALAAYVSTL